MDFNADYYYHIFNRGVDKRNIFLDKWNYIRFLESMREFNQGKVTNGLHKLYLDRKKDYQHGSPTPRGESDSKTDDPETSNKLINILCYCLNPNHYHLLVQQNTENGIIKFMQKLGTGYTNYFNNKYKRSGVLFQGKYKFKPVKSTEELLRVSVYVNCNAEIHGIAKKESWIWSSYLDYIGIRKGTLCNKKDIYEEFLNTEKIRKPKEYEKLCKEWVEDSRRIKYLEKYDLD